MKDKSAAASQQFAFALLAETLAEKPSENVFISPASVEIALAMTLNGARGKTRQAMSRALGQPARATLKAINTEQSALIASLTNPDDRVRLSIANALWARQGVAFKQPFLTRNSKFYGAEVTALDFSAEAAALATMNGWVSEKTEGKITKILDQVPPRAILYLMNAIYFKGAWAVEFDKQATQTRDFHLLSGAKKKQPLMYQHGRYNYLQGSGFQAVSLPYGKGRVSMYVFLPDESLGLASFASQLNAANWQSWMGQFRRTEGDIFIPRFKIEYEADLKTALSRMGMGIIFDDEAADFKGMCSLPGENVCVGEVKHKTFVDVNEEGTEAAAVTSVGMVRTTSVRLPEKTFRMVVDRPFLSAIVDNQTGSILFIGSIVEPK